MGGGAESPRAEGEKARGRVVESRGRWRREGRIREWGSGSGAVGWGLMGGRETREGMRGAIETPKGECPPRSGSVQRDCIRQAGIGLGRANARIGLPDTTFFILDHQGGSGR